MDNDEYVWVFQWPPHSESKAEIYVTRDEILSEWPDEILEKYKGCHNEMIEGWSLNHWAYKVEWQIYQHISNDRTKLNYQQWRELCKQQ